MCVFLFNFWKWLIVHSQLWFPSYLRVSHAEGWFLILLMEHHRGDGTTHSEGNSKVDPFKISYWESGPLSYLLYFRDRRNWSFAFTHASTSSKCIYFSICCLVQCNSFVKWPWGAGYIVSEMIDWLKVRDPALMKEIFWNPDNWEAPNSGSSTLGSADCVDGRCTQENWRRDSDSETGILVKSCNNLQSGQAWSKGSKLCNLCVIIGGCT